MNALQHRLVEIWWQWVVPLSWQLAVFVVLIAVVAWCAGRHRRDSVCAVVYGSGKNLSSPRSLAFIWGVGTWALRPAWEGLQAVATEETVVDSSPASVSSVAASADTSQDTSSSAPIPSSRGLSICCLLCGLLVV